MTKNLIKGALIGGLVAFAWGMISWMLLPWHMSTMNKFNNESMVGTMVKMNAPEPGIYVLPYPESFDKEAKIDTNMPFAFMSVVPQGVDCHKEMPQKMLISLLTQIITALLITLLLTRTSGLGYWCQTRFVALVGFTAGFATYIPDWNWWHFSTEYVVIGILDLLIAWFFAGMAIAKFTDID